MPNEKKWYYCEQCNRHTQNIEQINGCLRFGHSLKKRVPLKLRLVHQDIGYDVPHVVNLVVDGDKWVIQVTLLVFTTRRDIQKRMKTKFLTKVTLSPPINNMCDHLNHLFPSLQYTPKKLTSLLKNAIKRGIYKERGQGKAVIYLTLNDWMRLKPKNENSKLIYTSHSKLQRLFKSDREVLGE